ncbi:hypothetical protein BJY00DRAFT_179287 [Aspergillus carlsbadensis]|nr:hypothetical protein BJY00DRAFT_179287 [Aspergillus carlsbadensis]
MLHKALVIPFPLDHHNCTDSGREGGSGRSDQTVGAVNGEESDRHGGRVEREDDDVELSDKIEVRNEGKRKRVRGVQVTCAGVAVGQSRECRRSGLGSRSERSLSGVAPQQPRVSASLHRLPGPWNFDPSSSMQFLLCCFWRWKAAFTVQVLNF